MEDRAKKKVLTYLLLTFSLSAVFYWLIAAPFLSVSFMKRATRSTTGHRRRPRSASKPWSR